MWNGCVRERVNERAREREFVCTSVADCRSTTLHFWKNELLALKLHSITFLIHQVFSFFCLGKFGVYILLMVCMRRLVSTFLIIFLSSYMQIGEIYFLFWNTTFRFLHCLYFHTIHSGGEVVVVVGGVLKATVRTSSQNTQPIKHIYCQLGCEPFALCLIKLNKQAK